MPWHETRERERRSHWVGGKGFDNATGQQLGAVVCSLHSHAHGHAHGHRMSVVNRRVDRKRQHEGRKAPGECVCVWGLYHTMRTRPNDSVVLFDCGGRGRGREGGRASSAVVAEQEREQARCLAATEAEFSLPVSPHR